MDSNKKVRAMAKNGYTRRFPGQNRVPYANITITIPTTHPILAAFLPDAHDFGYLPLHQVHGLNEGTRLWPQQTTKTLAKRAHKHTNNAAVSQRWPRLGETLFSCGRTHRPQQYERPTYLITAPSMMNSQISSQQVVS